MPKRDPMTDKPSVAPDDEDEALIAIVSGMLSGNIDIDDRRATLVKLSRRIAELREKYEIADWCNEQSLRLYHAERKRAEAAEAALAACGDELNTEREQVTSYQGFVRQHANHIRGLMATLKPFADAVEQSAQTHKPVGCFVSQGEWEDARRAMERMRGYGFEPALKKEPTNG